ncbi:MAG: undecaprenyl-phosphate galactose phosphotransferase WbaP [Anaerolineales bacterium]|nr:undecaprenyl-phosphate galactose phosphotransferase WbaP [Anaerolineales bacterium]
MNNISPPPSDQSIPANVLIPARRWRGALVILTLVLGDLISFTLAFGLSLLLRSSAIIMVGGVIHWSVILPTLQLSLLTFLIIYALTGLYPAFGWTAVEEMRQIFSSLTLGFVVLGLAIYLQRTGPMFSRAVFILGWAFACFFNIIIRLAIRNRLSLLRWWGAPVIVVGPSAAVRDVTERLRHSRRLGLKPVLILDETAPPERSAVLSVPVIRSAALLEQILARQKISYAVYVEGKEDPRQQTRQRLDWLSKLFPTVLVVLADSPLGSLWVRTMDLEGRLTLRAQYHLLDRKSILLKRAFDIVLGGLLTLLTLPFLLLAILLVRLDSPGPVFHTQERLGLGGKRIRFIKLRTMHVNAEQRLEELLKNDSQARQEYQTYHKLAKDPRVTRIGRLLRKFSLDEWPQIWHVLPGEMSLVGPRAYMASELPDMGGHANLILQIRPGLTGWWQVMGRHNTTFQHRLQLDEYYLSNWSLWLDIYILIKTVWVVISGHGA